jgi:hypothetical protein
MRVARLDACRMERQRKESAGRDGWGPLWSASPNLEA